MTKRLARGDEGINPLDSACKDHDIAYASSKETKDRYSADKILQKAAMKRIVAKDSSLGERATAVGVAVAMKAKRALTRKGKGLSEKKKTKQVAFNTLVRSARAAIKKSNPIDAEAAVRVAVDAVKRSKHGKHVKKPRIIQVPTHMGGSLALIPIFSGLSVLGSIPGGAKGVIKAVNQCMDGVKEQKHNNGGIDAITIGNQKKGGSIYLHAGKSGAKSYLSLTEPKNL